MRNLPAINATKRDDHLLAILEDDGAGFDVNGPTGPAGPGRGLGLIGMRQRAEAVGGSIQLESAAGAGTTLFVRVPLHDNSASHDDES